MVEARFPITTARQELGFTPTTNVRANIDVRTGAGEVGAAIGQGILGLSREFVLINAKTQLGKQNIAASDEINKYFIELGDNDDPETYGQSLNGLFKELDSLTPKNGLAARAYNQRLARLKLSVAKETRNAAGKKIKSNAQSTDFLMLQKAKESGDFLPYKASVINGVKLGTYTAKEGESLLDDADIEIKIKQKNDVLAVALAQREGEDGVVLNEIAANDVIDSSDLATDVKEDLKNQVTNRAAQEKNQRDVAFRNKVGDESERLGTLLADRELIEQEINEVDLGGVGDQKTAEEAFKDKWKSLLHATVVRKEPLVSDEDVYDSLTVGSGLVKSGSKSPGDWETEFAEADAAGLLTPDDRRTLRSKDVVATQSMQNSTFTQTTTDNRASLVEATQSELQALVTARDLAVKLKDVPQINALEKALQKAQVQKWNFGRYRTELRQQIAQFPDWSQKQIFVASDILIAKYDKPFDVLSKEFDNDNPNAAILTAPPDDVFKDIWADLSQDDRALIWAERMAGTPVEVLLGSEEVLGAEK